MRICGMLEMPPLMLTRPQYRDVAIGNDGRGYDQWRLDVY